MNSDVHTDNTKLVQSAFKKTMGRETWLYLRGKPWKQRLKKYPFRTICFAFIDRYYFTWIQISKNPLVQTRTFWGAPITVRFTEYRSIVHDGLIDSKEIALEAYVVHNITAKDVFFDVGANVGFYTLLADALGAKVTAFEPMPRTFAILEKNAPNATLVEKALMDHEGMLLFADYGAGAGLNKALIGEEAEHTVEVAATTLDTYCNEHSVVPTFIKIDAENAESYVIEGALSLLSTHHPTVVIEGNEAIIERMQSLGYSAFQIHMDGSTVAYAHGDEIFNDNLLFTHPSQQ